MEIRKQIPQGMDGKEPPVRRPLEEASYVVGRCKESTTGVEPSEGFKGRQIEELKEFATLTNLWINISQHDLIFLDKGGENEVFHDKNCSVIKLNNFEYAGDDLSNFFIRIIAHNYFFNNIPYDLIGFSENSQHEFCAVLTQPFVHAVREAKIIEIREYMHQLGFDTGKYNDEYHTDKYEIFDAAPNNVLYGKDNILYFIDTQIRLLDS